MPRQASGCFGALIAAVASLSAASGQEPGIEFVTIGAPGNAPYPGPPGWYTTGRGGVGYEYRIGRYEVTTSQWMEFVNTFSTRPGEAPANFARPIGWGAEPDPTYAGPGTRYRLAGIPGAGMVPVTGIDWRTAARFCNWLCNDKAPTFAATSNGAYDASTFGFRPDGTFTDQITRSPGAEYWIPSLDEWMKAAHYDPDRFGPGLGGWWEYSNRSNTELIPGPPGIGQANSGFNLPSFGEWFIPLGSYPGTQTPWGLLDAAGGAKEWNENTDLVHPFNRGSDGSYLGCTFYEMDQDWVRVTDASHPLGRAFMGLRVASSVPGPGVLAAFIVAAGVFVVGPRRSQ